MKSFLKRLFTSASLDSGSKRGTGSIEKELNACRKDTISLGFHGDFHLIRSVADALSRSTYFIETGTNQGQTLQYVSRHFPYVGCFSCDPVEENYAAAKRACAGRTNVHLSKTPSPQFLKFVADNAPETTQQPCVFWLDAHGEGFPLPLRDEISFILSHFQRAYIFVDDFRVPGMRQFGFDRYQDGAISFSLLTDLPERTMPLECLLPAYSERTSTHHPLRGWTCICLNMDIPRLHGSIDKMEMPPVPHKPGEIDKCSLLDLVDRRDPIVLEAGAAQGSDTVELAGLWPNGTVVAIEPEPRLQAQLRRNTSDLQNVVLCELALAAQAGDTAFFVSEKGGRVVTSSAILAPKEHIEFHPDIKFNTEIRVKTTTIDSLLDELELPAANFLWLDLQGAEPMVLRAAPVTRNTATVIYTEVMFRPLYEDVVLFDAFRVELEEAGFELVRAWKIYQNAGNALFARPQSCIGVKD